MSSLRDSLVLDGIGLGAAALVIGGLVTVGGPETARAERRDQARLSDLHELASYINCLSAEAGEVLPTALGPAVRTCSEDPPLVDRTDGAPFSYERLSETSFRICARFERPDRMETGGYVRYSFERFEPSTGCLSATLPR